MIVSSGKPRLYLDSNIYIWLYERTEPEDRTVRDNLWRLFDHTNEPRWIIVTSELTIAEVAVDPLRKGSHALLDECVSAIASSDGERIAVPVDRNILLTSATTRARFASLRLPDAIHLATAIDTGCVAFVTDDQRLHGLPDREGDIPLKMYGVTVPDIDRLLESVR